MKVLAIAGVFLMCSCKPGPTLLSGTGDIPTFRALKKNEEVTCLYMEYRTFYCHTKDQKWFVIEAAE